MSGTGSLEPASWNSRRTSFGSVAAQYAALRPSYPDDAVRFVLGEGPRRVLDLGAGTGLLTGFVRATYPEAELTLLDGAAPMLDRARATLGDERTRYVVGDLADPLPDGPWDAIVSALAIHHLDDAGKRALFARVRGALAAGGVFVNAEQVAGESPWLDAVYVE